MYSFHGQCIDVPKTFTNLWPWNKVSQDILMGIIDFILFILFIGFSQQEDWNGLPFPSLVDHILSELSMTCLSWVALHVMAHSFIELCSPFSWQGCELWTKDQVANIHWIIEKAREFQKNIYFCFIDYTKAFVWITTNWKIFKEMGIPDHLNCLLRNLCADQEATIRTLHGTTDLFKIGKGVPQGCISSPYLFNFCRVHHGKCQTGWITSWNQDC